ncbi:MAG TPA: hypothetical protein VNT79_08525, partial [Phycisphaerae bacterium]|nr:hypothetical protein [Phycisphaerae bacterium]
MALANLTARKLLPLSLIIFTWACDRKPAREAAPPPKTDAPAAKSSDQRDLDQFLKSDRQQATTQPQ